MTIKPNHFRHVGTAYRVEAPEWAGDPATRGNAGRLEVATDHQTVSLVLDGDIILNLNADTAAALGVALIVVADKKGA
jgi:hypothetical protein